MRQRSQDGVEHEIEFSTEVFGQKPQHEIAVLLQSLDLATVAAVFGSSDRKSTM
jgi:hypothetical protein